MVCTRARDVRVLRRRGGRQLTGKWWIPPGARWDAVDGSERRGANVAITGLEVIRQMVERTNAHDLEGLASLIHEDYQSEQPFHPARGFGGRAQMKANWGAILAGVPDLRAEVPMSVEDADVVWSEWHWWGTSEQGKPFDMRDHPIHGAGRARRQWPTLRGARRTAGRRRYQRHRAGPIGPPAATRALRQLPWPNDDARTATGRDDQLARVSRSACPSSTPLRRLPRGSDPGRAGGTPFVTPCWAHECRRSARAPVAAEEEVP